MFEKYLKRARQIENEKLNYKVKKLNIPKTHTGAHTLQMKILNNVRIKHLQKQALILILSSPPSELIEIAGDVLPILLGLLLDRESPVLFRATEKVIKIYEDQGLLFKYLKCYVFNDLILAEKYLKILLRCKRTWVYENKKDICSLIPIPDLSKRVLNLKYKEEVVALGTLDWYNKENSID